MQYNILLTGVGGQGILSVAFVICNAALEEGLNFKQAEVHGMAVRGGAVQSNLRLSSDPIYSDLIPRGKCDLLLSVEPLEVLRYLEYLGPHSSIVTSINPVVNIPNYPPMDDIWSKLDGMSDVIPVDADSLAKQAGSAQAANMAMLGAGSERLPLKLEGLEKWVTNLWKEKGERIVEINLKAFHAGRKMSEFLRACGKAGVSPSGIRALTSHVPFESANPSDADKWVDFLKETPSEKWSEAITSRV